MRAHQAVRSARHRGWGLNASRRPGALLALCVAAWAGQGCIDPPGLAGSDPSDPAARAPAAPYRSVTSGYQSRRPVEPAPWRERNDRVAPAEKR
jgi:hypothetical protein